MNVKELIERTDDHNPSDPTTAFMCGACGRVTNPRFMSGGDPYGDARASAERCCRPVLCDCGQEAAKHRTSCEACLSASQARREQAIRDKATKFTVATAPDEPVCYNDDQFFQCVGDCLSQLESDGVGEDDPGDEAPWPLVVWLCEARTPQIDEDRVIEDFVENLELGDGVEAGSVCTGLDELHEFMVSWNARQQPNLWMPEDERCILVQREDVYGPAEPVTTEEGEPNVDPGDPES